MAWNYLTGEWNIYANRADFADYCRDCQEEFARLRELEIEKYRQIDRWHLDTGRRASMRLDTYHPQHESQKKALEFAKILAEIWSQKLTGSIWMWSSTFGLGKTHLMYALLWEAVQQGKKIAVKDEVSLLTEIRATYSAENGTKYTEDDLLREASDVDVLGWDDIGRGYVRSQSMDWYQGIIYKVLNIRYEKDKPIIVTSNMTPTALRARVGGAAYSRLKGMCPVALKLEGEDYRLREA